MTRLLALIAATLISVPAAKAAHVEFSGSLCFSSVTAACGNGGWNVDSCFLTRFEPMNVGDAGATTRLDLFGHTYTVDLFSPTSSLIGQTYEPVTVTKIAMSGYTFTSKVRFTKQSPTSPSATTTFITMEGDIQNWDNIPGCVVGFSAAHTLCPHNGYC